MTRNKLQEEKKSIMSACNLSYSKVIKEKWGQYFKIDHFCTPLCSKRSANIVIKNFLEQKFAKSSVINLVPNAWFNDKNAIKKVRVELVFRYCLYYALWLWLQAKTIRAYIWWKTLLQKRPPTEVDFLSKMIKTQYNATNLSMRFSRNLSKHPNQNS